MGVYKSGTRFDRGRGGYLYQYRPLNIMDLPSQFFSTKAPPTAFTPEPVRRRVAAHETDSIDDCGGGVWETKDRVRGGQAKVAAAATLEP